MSNSNTATTARATISAKAEREKLAAHMDDICLDLEDYDGYVGDAISQLANDNISQFDDDQVEFCREHADLVAEALRDGLAIETRDFFANSPHKTHLDYEAHLGICAWYMDAERRLYDGLADAVAYMVLGHLADVFDDALDAEAWDMVCPAPWDDVDTNERLESICEDAEDAYREALEEAIA